MQNIKMFRGAPGTFWSLEPLKRDFLHSETTFTTNFTAQILRKNKEPNIIIYSEFHIIL